MFINNYLICIPKYTMDASRVRTIPVRVPYAIHCAQHSLNSKCIMYCTYLKMNYEYKNICTRCVEWDAGRMLIIHMNLMLNKYLASHNNQTSLMVFHLAEGDFWWCRCCWWWWFGCWCWLWAPVIMFEKEDMTS